MSATTHDSLADSRPAGLDAALLGARLLLVAIFPISGYFKASAIERTTGYFASLGAPMPSVAVWVAILAEFILPVLVALGIRTRWAAIGLILYVIGTSIIGHRFWEAAPPAYFGQLMSFMKNLCMVGGLGLIAMIGPGRFAVQPRP